MEKFSCRHFFVSFLIFILLLAFVPVAVFADEVAGAETDQPVLAVENPANVPEQAELVLNAAEEFNVTFEANDNAAFFNDDGEEYATSITLSFPAGAEIDGFSADRPGYKAAMMPFVGWSTQKNATKPDSNIIVKGDMTLYAVYIQTYFVTFHINRDDLSEAYVEAWIDGGYKPCESAKAIYNEGDDICDYQLVDPVIVNPQLILMGWAADPNAKEPDSSIIVDGPKDVYAVWGTASALDPCTVSINPASSVYNCKAIKPEVTVRKDGKTLEAGKDYEISFKNNINAGKATVVVTGKGVYTGSVNNTFTINKATQTLKVKQTAKQKKITLKFNTLKKKNLTKKITAVGQVTGNKTALTYTKAKGNKKITVAKNGKITIEKGIKKGTYTVKIKASASANENYQAASTTISVKFVVK